MCPPPNASQSPDLQLSVSRHNSTQEERNVRHLALLLAKMVPTIGDTGGRTSNTHIKGLSSAEVNSHGQFFLTFFRGRLPAGANANPPHTYLISSRANGHLSTNKVNVTIRGVRSVVGGTPDQVGGVAADGGNGPGRYPHTVFQKKIGPSKTRPSFHGQHAQLDDLHLACAQRHCVTQFVGVARRLSCHKAREALADGARAPDVVRER